MSEREEIKLVIHQRIQAGDVWLLHFKCPLCLWENLSGWPIERCDGCHMDLSKAELEIQTGPGSLRILSGRERRHKFSIKVIRAMLTEQGGQCAYCDNELMENYHIDHIRPVSAGGSNERDNLCLSCARCNLTASSKEFSSFAAKRDYLKRATSKKLGGL